MSGNQTKVNSINAENINFLPTRALLTHLVKDIKQTKHRHFVHESSFSMPRALRRTSRCDSPVPRNTDWESILYTELRNQIQIQLKTNNQFTFFNKKKILLQNSNSASHLTLSYHKVGSSLAQFVINNTEDFEPLAYYLPAYIPLKLGSGLYQSELPSGSKMKVFVFIH